MPQARPNVVMQMRRDLIRVLAPNPSPMTYWGTNCYILGDAAQRVLIDAGPQDAAHFQRIFDALPVGVEISHILITHAHKDHSAGAAQMAALTGAKLYAFGDATSGRSAQMEALAHDGMSGGGEGIDASFAPDITLEHNEILPTQAGEITALHTPGHMGNHLCFAWNDCVFSGDLIMGWSSSLISPPDGDAAAFRQSCEMILARKNARLLPAHGAPIEDGHSRIAELHTHRQTREDQILAILKQAQEDDEILNIAQITKRVYHALDPRALPAARRNCFAHLIDLTHRKKIVATPNLSQDAHFFLKS